MRDSHPGSVSFGEMATGLRFLARLPAFLRRPLTVAEARSIARRRLEQRVPDFLALARAAIYERPESPYLQLLRAAGCEYGDLARLVARPADPLPRGRLSHGRGIQGSPTRGARRRV